MSSQQSDAASFMSTTSTICPDKSFNSSTTTLTNTSATSGKAKLPASNSQKADLSSASQFSKAAARNGWTSTTATKPSFSG
ncbi:hypothetical protein CPC08DRAFT_702363 [Agrocybe pediades]|nr:hypothetical protein CPC08DRAFT_702363 [Agrocybe pediades]